MTIVLQFGLLFWFLSRPKAENRFAPAMTQP